MSEEILSQADMLAKLPRHKEPEMAHLFMPRYKDVGMLLTKYKYEQHELHVIAKLIETIKAYAND